MAKNKKQGTEWETHVVRLLRDSGYPDADRLPEKGSRDEGDVGGSLPKGAPADIRNRPLVVLAWKRLVRPYKGAKRRVPDGVRDVIVLTPQDFLALLRGERFSRIIVECKASEYENVTRILAKARQKAGL